MNEKTMPHNIDAEKSVLGSMFLSKYAMQKAIEALNKDLFYLDSHIKIFSAIAFLSEKNTPIDVTTVTEELENRKELKQIGGVEYLTEIINFVPTAANVDEYIRIVEEKAILRRLIEEATQIVSSGYNQQEDLSEVLDSGFIEQYKDRLVYTTVPETEEKIPTGIYVEDLEKFKGAYLNEAVLGIILNTEKIESAKEFIYFIFNYNI